MAKLLLVEDDNNLREIYQARLTAEGYDIIAAQNGEDALSLAKLNHPDLIISDVMMPRISGFEMLDILRNTDELKSTKVIMLTALGQAEDRGRADNLGADKYLVKSQVTLEDIVTAAKELLGDLPTPTPEAATTQLTSPTPVATLPAEPAATQTVAINTPAADASPVTTIPVADPDPIQPITPTTPVPSESQTPSTPVQPVPIVQQPVPLPAPATIPIHAATPLTTTIPADNNLATPNEAIKTIVNVAAPQTVSAEEAAVQAQIDAFEASPMTPDGMPELDAVNETDPTASIDTPIEQAAAAPANNDELITAAVQELSNAASQPISAAVPPSQASPNTLDPAAPLAQPAQTAPMSLPPPAEASAASPALMSPQPGTPQDNATVSSQSTTNDTVTVAGKKIIQPLNDIATGPNLTELLAKEAARETAANATPTTESSVPQAETATPGNTSPANPAVDPNTIAL